MKKTQITSPIIIFLLIILGLTLLYYKTSIDNTIIRGLQEETLTDIQQHNQMQDELRFRNNLTSYVVNIAGNYNTTNSLTQAIMQEYTLDNINYNFITDNYDSTLRWWQEPISSFESLLEIKPDIVEIAGLALPLNFRWLRRIACEKVK